MTTAVLPSSRNAIGLRGDEMAGLVIAAVAHVVIVGALAISALRAPAVIPAPARVAVNLTEDVGLDSAAPEVAQDGQASVADRIGEVPVPPKPIEKPAPPKMVEKPKAAKKPVVSMDASSVRKKPTPVATPKNAGASRLGDDFKKGLGEKVDANAPVPASQIGSDAKASLREAINRQIKPYWQPPSGADADELKTYLNFDLNPDGSLAGEPRVIRQGGVTDANKPQASRHAELAVRAVRRAAPFDLPPKYYNGWKHITNWEFKWTPQ